MQRKTSQPNSRSVVEKAEKIQKELAANPELVSALQQSGLIQSMLISHETSFSGPLPPPDVIRDYNTILPGGAERIFAMAEKEQSHRHSVNTTAIEGAIKRDRRGQWMGFLITIIILAIASFFAYRGNTTFAGALVAIDLLGLVSVFVLGRKLQKPDES